MAGVPVARQPKRSEPPAFAGGGDGNVVTTWKLRRRVAKTLRLIGAHLDLNQEDTLELFSREFSNYLSRLQAKDMAERKESE